MTVKAIKRLILHYLQFEFQSHNIVAYTARETRSKEIRVFPPYKNIHQSKNATELPEVVAGMVHQK